MSEYAKLVDGKVIPVDSVIEWAKWHGTNDRRINLTKIKGVKVSTVFLGVNHGWTGIDLWFETMVFGGEYDEYQERYETLEEAKAGHEQIVKMVRESEGE